MKKFGTILLVLLFGWASTTFAQSAAESAPVDNFYDTKHVPEIRISFKQANWQDRLDSLRLYGDGLAIGNVKIDGQAYANVGIRFRGNKSFSPGGKRNPFHLKLNYFQKEQNHQGHKVVKLSTALRDPSLVREVLGYEIARQYMPAPRANYTKVYVNDEYYGLFVNVEPIDDELLQREFGSTEGTLLKAHSDLDMKLPYGCKKNLFASLEYEEDPVCYTYNWELKTDEGWDDLMELAAVLDQEPDKISSVLDIDRTLWMLAFNNVIVNLSSYSGQHSQNYYLYKDASGRFNPIIWDLNLAFGSFKNIGKGSDLAFNELIMLDPLLHVDNPTKPLISKLLADENNKKVYLSHIRTILYEHFVDGAYEERAKELQRLIQVPFFNDPNKYYSGDEFQTSLDKTIGKRSKIPGIIELMGKRARFLKKHPKIAIFPPEVEEVKVLKREQFSNKMVQTFNIQATVGKLPKRVKVYYRFNSTDDFAEAYMADDGKSNDGEAGDSIYGISLDPKGNGDSIEYFIFAENTSAASFSPVNYMYEPYTSTLKELN